MICKLCGKDSDLVDSHIIAETFYESVYDNGHRTVPLSTESNKLMIIQKGLTEKLLCKGCDGKFGIWENLFKRDLVDIGNLKSKFLSISKLNNGLILVKGTRYKIFKLAVLSIIWRLSISKNVFFSKHKLGIFEEDIKNILLKEIEPDEIEYPVMVRRYEINGKFAPGFLGGFPPAIFNNTELNRFIVWGHCFYIFMTKKFPYRITPSPFLQKSGDLFISTTDFSSFSESALNNSVFSKLMDPEVSKLFERLK